MYTISVFAETKLESEGCSDVFEACSAARRLSQDGEPAQVRISAELNGDCIVERVFPVIPRAEPSEENLEEICTLMRDEVFPTPFFVSFSQVMGYDI